MYHPKQGMVFAPLKTGIDFAHSLQSGEWFSRELQDCMNVLVVSIHRLF